MGATGLRQTQRQQHSPSMAPRLQRAVRLLQLSSMDFVLEVRQALNSNPFLEGDEEAPEAASAADAAASEDEAAAGPAPGETADERGDPPSDGGDGDSAAGDRDPWLFDPGRLPRSGSSDLPEDGGDWTAAPTTLADHLHGQLNVLRLPWRDLVLARAIVESLDDDGYLREPLPLPGGVPGLDPAADAGEWPIALRRVQALEPAGVGARTVAECLSLQLAPGPGTEDAADCALARQIVDKHLDLLARRDIAALARALRAPAAAVERACGRIRSLDPRPGWRFGSDTPQYITPDVVVRRKGQRWVATLNQRLVPRLRLNETYTDLFRRHRRSGHGAMAAQLQEARWTLHNVQQRFATIESVAQAIVDRQGLFFEYGPMAMKPLGLREIAAEVGAHASTVCRVTNNKYMATPVGVFELKYFFSRALPTAAGGRCSPTALKQLIRDMIAAEDPREPLSDAQIARDLLGQGLPIVRRTVTKYRQGMAIDTADSRRRVT